MFGAPDPNQVCCIDAVLAALQMQRRLVTLNEENQKQGIPDVYQRIGIHYGSTIVGNVGTESRLEYTAIGDTVKHQIDTHFVASITVRGKAKALDLYTTEGD
jgi:adenylate cyclase